MEVPLAPAYRLLVLFPVAVLVAACGQGGVDWWTEGSGEGGGAGGGASEEDSDLDPADAPGGGGPCRLCDEDDDCPGNQICCSGVCAPRGEGCDDEVPEGAPLCADCDVEDDCVPGLVCCRRHCLPPGLADRYGCPIHECDNGETRACDTGLPGDCAEGKQTCRGRKWRECEPVAAEPEICNGLDDDCDGEVPRAEVDDDGDGWSPCAGDCDDARPEAFPGADEACNGLDDDCDGEVPDDEVDGDADGWSPCEGDCDDDRIEAFPGADEACNGLDDDCDGEVPDDEVDGDGDGFSPCKGDCDDTRPEAFPGAEEVCNGLDDDCDGDIPWEEVDGDGDGFAGCAGDCDDEDPAAAPGLEEVCDGVDNDCDGTIDLDADGNGLCPIGRFCDDDDDCRGDLVCISLGDESRCSRWCNNSTEFPGPVPDHECPRGTGCLFAVDTDSAGWCWPTRGRRLLGARCRRDRDCRSRLCEALPSGRKVCLDTCSSTADCLRHLLPVELSCVPLDFDAGRPAYTHGQCIVAPGGGRTGDPCDAPEDCRDGVCLVDDDVCADTCCTSADCPADHHCRYLAGLGDSSLKVCLRYPAGNRAFGEACEDHLLAGSCACVGALCLEPTRPGQGFCSGTCCRDADCPDGWSCELAVELPFSAGTARACIPPLDP